MLPGDARAVDVAAARVTVGGELRLDAVDGAVLRALLGALDRGLDGVVADGVPAVFLVAHVARSGSVCVCVFVYVYVQNRLRVKKIQAPGAENFGEKV